MNKSNIEEIIGILWLILAVTGIIAELQWITVIAGFLGLFSICCAMYYGYKLGKDKLDKEKEV